MRYAEIMESMGPELEAEVDMIKAEFHPEEGDDFMAVVDIIVNGSAFSFAELFNAYVQKFGNPLRPSKKKK